MKLQRRYRPVINIKTPTDAKLMPVTGETAEERLANCLPLFDTPGQQYVERRGISVDIAHDAGVRYDPHWNGRPAVIVPMRGLHRELCSLHGRYLMQAGHQNKMLTIGPGGGILSINEAINSEIVIIVEGLFDALSLALCGYDSLATVGRVAPWLPQVCKGKTVFLAFDGNYAGDMVAKFYEQFLEGATSYRLAPPEHDKDWNSALLKRGRIAVVQWLRYSMRRATTSKTIR